MRRGVTDSRDFDCFSVLLRGLEASLFEELLFELLDLLFLSSREEVLVFKDEVYQHSVIVLLLPSFKGGVSVSDDRNKQVHEHDHKNNRVEQRE